MPKVKYAESTLCKFEQRFGKRIEDFDAIQRAIEALNEETKHSYYQELPRFFLWLDEDPDQVIANRKAHIKTDDETSDYYERKVKAYKKMLEEAMTGRTTASRIGRIQGFFANNSKKYALDSVSILFNFFISLLVCLFFLNISLNIQILKKNLKNRKRSKKISFSF